MKISYVAPVLDLSGYAEFARNVIYSLHTNGHDIAVDQISFEPDRADHGELGDLIRTLSRKKLVPEVNIINTIPPLFKNYVKSNCLNIGYTMFEIDKIPIDWVQACNRLNGIMVPSQWCLNIFKQSGVNVPIAVVEPYVPPMPKNFVHKKDDTFTFYSIFQWSERKNPKGLLKAYWSAFTGIDNVKLVIKTYRKARNEQENNLIQKDIEEVKQNLRLRHYPAIEVITSAMSKAEIRDLHSRFHCYVSAHRGEGLSMPIAEAMVLGNPVIATGYSGSETYLDRNTGWPIGFTLTPVYGMDLFGSWYPGDAMWAEIDMRELIETMRLLYNNSTNKPKRAAEHMATFTAERCASSIKAFVESLW